MGSERHDPTKSLGQEGKRGNGRQKELTTLALLLFYVLVVAPLQLLVGLVRRHFLDNKKSVKGKVCLVTGAGRGLGRGLAEKMATLGAEVICVDLNEETNQETVERIKAAGGKARGYIANVAKEEQIQELAEKVGRVDILINNAGLIPFSLLGDMTSKEIIASFGVNILGNYWTVMNFLPGMKKRGEGHIVFISSLSAIVPFPYFSVYGPTKAALSNFSSALRLELEAVEKRHDIKVTNIQPYIMNTHNGYTDEADPRIPQVKQESAVEDIVDAILNEEEDITIPRYLNIPSAFSRLIPVKHYVYVYDLLKIVKRLRYTNGYRPGHYGQIVEDTAGVES